MEDRMTGEPGTIERIDEILHYFDMDGNEILEGDTVRMNADDLPHSREIEVMASDDEEYLGEDATNPVWVQNGRAYPGEFGMYPFNQEDLRHMELIKKRRV